MASRRSDIQYTVELIPDVSKFSKNLEGQLGRLNKTGGKLKQSFEQPLGRITNKATEFDKSIEAATARVIAFGASAGAIFQIKSALEQTFTQAIKIDKALAEINTTLQATSSGIEKFGNSLFKIATDTAQSFDTAAEAAKEFARQGLSIERTLQATNAALILSRQTGLSATASVETLTAAVNSFNKEGVTYEQVINRVISVDQAFAVSARDLAEGLARSGSSAQDAKVSMNELFAAITAVQQQTARGGKVIGNGFKTIFTRLQRSSTLDQLEQLNIQVRDLEGNTLPALQILEQLAKNYDGASDAQRSLTSELVAGVFQINTLKALFSDLNNEVGAYQTALKIANNATDEAIRKNEKLNEALGAILNKFALDLQKGAATFGDTLFGPLIRNADALFNSLNTALNPEKLGFDLADTLIKALASGLRETLSGPGLIFGIPIAVNLARKFGGYIVEALRSLSVNVQQVNQTLQQQPEILGKVAGVAQQNVGIQTKLLNLYRQQNLELNKQRSGVPTGPLIRAGIPPKMGRKAIGEIPNFIARAELAEANSLYGGATKAIATTIKTGGGNSQANEQKLLNSYGRANGDIPNFARQNVVVNNAERRLITPEGNEGVLTPTLMRRLDTGRMQRDGFRIQAFAANGTIPNFAVRGSFGNRNPFTGSRSANIKEISGLDGVSQLVKAIRKEGITDVNAGLVLNLPAFLEALRNKDRLKKLTGGQLKSITGIVDQKNIVSGKTLSGQTRDITSDELAALMPYITGQKGNQLDFRINLAKGMIPNFASQGGMNPSKAREMFMALVMGGSLMGVGTAEFTRPHKQSNIKTPTAIIRKAPFIRSDWNPPLPDASHVTPLDPRGYSLYKPRLPPGLLDIDPIALEKKLSPKPIAKSRTPITLREMKLIASDIIGNRYFRGGLFGGAIGGIMSVWLSALGGMFGGRKRLAPMKLVPSRANNFSVAELKARRENIRNAGFRNYNARSELRSLAGRTGALTQAGASKTLLSELVQQSFLTGSAGTDILGQKRTATKADLVNRINTAESAVFTNDSTQTINSKAARSVFERLRQANSGERSTRSLVLEINNRLGLNSKTSPFKSATKGRTRVISSDNLNFGDELKITKGSRGSGKDYLRNVLNNIIFSQSDVNTQGLLRSIGFSPTGVSGNNSAVFDRFGVKSNKDVADIMLKRFGIKSAKGLDSFGLGAKLNNAVIDSLINPRGSFDARKANMPRFMRRAMGEIPNFNMRRFPVGRSQLPNRQATMAERLNYISDMLDKPSIGHLLRLTRSDTGFRKALLKTDWEVLRHLNGEDMSVMARSLGKANKLLSFSPRGHNSTFTLDFSSFSSAKSLWEATMQNNNMPRFAKGLVPNFNNPLADAINREKAAGVPSNRIRVGFDPRVGIGVYNTRDEPAGLSQGVNRVLSEGGNPRMSGIPNFVNQFSREALQKLPINELDLIADTLGIPRDIAAKSSKTELIKLIGNASKDSPRRDLVLEGFRSSQKRQQNLRNNPNNPNVTSVNVGRSTKLGTDQLSSRNINFRQSQSLPSNRFNNLTKQDKLAKSFSNSSKLGTLAFAAPFALGGASEFVGGQETQAGRITSGIGTAAGLGLSIASLGGIGGPIGLAVGSIVAAGVIFTNLNKNVADLNREIENNIAQKQQEVNAISQYLQAQSQLITALESGNLDSTQLENLQTQRSASFSGLTNKQKIQVLKAGNDPKALQGVFDQISQESTKETGLAKAKLAINNAGGINKTFQQVLGLDFSGVLGRPSEEQLKGIVAEFSKQGLTLDTLPEDIRVLLDETFGTKTKRRLKELLEESDKTSDGLNKVSEAQTDYTKSVLVFQQNLKKLTNEFETISFVNNIKRQNELTLNSSRIDTLAQTSNLNPLSQINFNSRNQELVAKQQANNVFASLNDRALELLGKAGGSGISAVSPFLQRGLENPNDAVSALFDFIKSGKGSADEITRLRIEASKLKRTFFETQKTLITNLKLSREELEFRKKALQQQGINEIIGGKKTNAKDRRLIDLGIQASVREDIKPKPSTVERERLNNVKTLFSLGLGRGQLRRGTRDFSSKARNRVKIVQKVKAPFRQRSNAALEGLIAQQRNDPFFNLDDVDETTRRLATRGAQQRLFEYNQSGFLNTVDAILATPKLDLNDTARATLRQAAVNASYGRIERDDSRRTGYTGGALTDNFDLGVLRNYYEREGGEVRGGGADFDAILKRIQKEAQRFQDQREKFREKSEDDVLNKFFGNPTKELTEAIRELTQKINETGREFLFKPNGRRSDFSQALTINTDSQKLQERQKQLSAGIAANFAVIAARDKKTDITAKQGVVQADLENAKTTVSSAEKKLLDNEFINALPEEQRKELLAKLKELSINYSGSDFLEQGAAAIRDVPFTPRRGNLAPSREEALLLNRQQPERFSGMLNAFDKESDTGREKSEEFEKRKAELEGLRQVVDAKLQAFEKIAATVIEGNLTSNTVIKIDGLDLEDALSKIEKNATAEAKMQVQAQIKLMREQIATLFDKLGVTPPPKQPDTQSPQ